MRVFESLGDAASEIRRDISKGPKMISTRVQQQIGLNLETRERIGYTYSVLGNFPPFSFELVEFAIEEGFVFWEEHKIAMHQWLEAECKARIAPGLFLEWDEPTEVEHPALSKTFEGSWPSYTYTERMIGGFDALYASLKKDPDTRRAFWPIFRTEDSIRASVPSRIPCSLGYQAMIRKVGASEKLILTYLQRSADFDRFWLSDLWLARKFQENLANSLELECGAIIHFIISFHSFDVTTEEIY